MNTRLNRFQNLVAADVSRLKYPGKWSGLTFAATVLKEARLSRFVLLTLIIGLCAPVFARNVLPGRAPALQRMEFTVAGVAREALVYVPAGARETNTPVVFVFHGHGGSARQAARSFAMNAEWPEAISVCMDGLNTPGQLTDPEGKRSGWQARPGDQGDRDLKFFDAVLARLKKDFKVDDKRVYATGHSNGGGFTYLLWAERGDVFAAVAPSAAVARYVDKLKPKPAMHLAGEKDTLVKYAWQQAMMRAVRELNGCAIEGTDWGKYCLRYESKQGTDVVTFIFPGGHEFNREAPAMIVKFFKEHPAK